MTSRRIQDTIHLHPPSLSTFSKLRGEICGISYKIYNEFVNSNWTGQTASDSRVSIIHVGLA